MSDQASRDEIYYYDAFQRLLYASNDSSSIAPLDHPFQHMNFSDNYLHGSPDYMSSTYTSNIPTQKDDSLVMISPSTEAGNEEEEQEANISKKFKQSKVDEEDGGEGSKKIGKTKKVEKKEKGPRFAFVTKSNTDHLEDGYRWRKYGQKAVKNTPYPRGYYRCTTQNCHVKKRVERSSEDPSVVITTYEGSHNHHLPRNAAKTGPSFHNSLSYHIRNYEDRDGTTRSNDIMYYHDALYNDLTPLHHQQFNA